MASEESKFGLKIASIQKMLAIFNRKQNIKKVILYGSRAMGNYRPGSDIDLTLIGELLTMEELLKIENELDQLLLPHKIDLSLFHKIENQALLEHIKKFGVDFSN